MKKLKTLLYGFFAAAMITGCSDDTINNTDPGNSSNNGETREDAFMQLDIQMPDGLSGLSRSTTIEGGGSTGGVEIGKDEENRVSSALIVLAASEQVGSMPEYGFITSGEVRSNRIADLTSPTSKEYRATAGIQKEYLEALYDLYANNNLLSDDATEGPKVYVFVFCNPTSDLLDAIDKGELFGTTDWLDETCTVIQDNPAEPNRNIGIWGANSFLMNNVSVTTRALPAKITDWQYYNSVENPFRLSATNEQCGVDNSEDNAVTPRGAVKVERSVARFDFRDGSELGNNTYNVLYQTKADGTIDDAFPVANVQLTKMCLVNMSNKFYYLPRVSDNGLLTGDNYKILGREKPWSETVNGSSISYTGGNYLVGPYAQAFTAYGDGTSADSGVDENFSFYFNYPFFEDNGSFNTSEATWERWYVSNIDDVLKGQNDSYVGTDEITGNENHTDHNHKAGDYKIWRYVTENLIPAPRRSQKNGISTGIVFKARMHGTSEALNNTNANEEAWNKGYIKNIAECLNGGTYTYQGKTQTGLKGNSHDDPILYYFNGRLYMGWRHIRQAAIQASVSFNNGEPVINRSNSLYKAVFGEGPIPAGNTYIDTDGETHVDFTDSWWTPNAAGWTESANYRNYLASADYAWTAWYNDGEKGVGAVDDPLNVPELLHKMRQAVSGAGITIYQSSIDDGVPGYYCYYYYWNRHNDNGKNGTMGPMEFDVVRNNVYKLSVDKINRLGHPRIPENDPNNPTPDTPDESEELYLAVKVQIVPWAVRINSITF